MADYFGAASDLFSGAGSLFGGNATAKGDAAAAAGYFKAAALTKTETALKETALNREIYKTIGGGIADVATGGLTQSGSAEDLLRSSAAQGALSKGLVQLQGDITASSYTAQGQQAQALASANKSTGIFGFLGGLAKAGGALGLLGL